MDLFLHDTREFRPVLYQHTDDEFADRRKTKQQTRKKGRRR